MANNKFTLFRKKHPILFNIMLIVAVDFILLAIGYFSLGKFTHHNEFQVVPDLRGLSIEESERILRSNNLSFEVTDSIYDANIKPGCVLDQTPKAGSKIKTNRTVYITIRSLSTKLVDMPAIIDMSMRQGMSTLQGLGISNITVKRIPSEYPDLVLGAEMNGLPLHSGDRIPVNARITLIIGDGAEEIADTALLNNYNEALLNELENPESEYQTDYDSYQ